MLLRATEQLSLRVCSRCRHDLVQAQRTGTKIFIRARSSQGVKTAVRSANSNLSRSSVSGVYPDTPRYARPPNHPKPRLPQEGEEKRRFTLTPEQLPDHLAQAVRTWAKKPHVARRLCAFGIAEKDIESLLTSYTGAIRAHGVLQALEYDDEQLTRMVEDLTHADNNGMLDIYLTKLLFEWAHHSRGRADLETEVSSATLSKMSELFELSDLSHPAALYPETRRARPRRVIMHVGPTNSGKTHNALRALAAAKSGIYAGPLRLLAHEIWERLNKGQIVPLGVDPDKDAEPALDSNLDAADAVPIIRKTGREQYARACNMLTGEEQKIVQEHGALLSCTVEMVPLMSEVDVAIIDEIQLIADPDRGGAWTNAVLGVNAAVLHLCGEERAVPLIEALLRDTGDELVVNRYERLTPLHVAKESLHGDLSRVEKGDCVVAFSRTKIFELKKVIEKQTGMRCAVAYGRLPPEIRSEQAALFNKPNNDYNILVGSDAIGMGLNLKIKRIILDSVRKWNGTREVLASTSQIKQIAGRAGRFGLHGEDDSGGVVTTLHEGDLQVVRRALEVPMQPIKYARITLNADLFGAVVHALPQGSDSNDALDVFQYVSKVHPQFAIEDVARMKDKVEFVNDIKDGVTIRDRVMLQSAPFPIKDERGSDIVRSILRLYEDKLQVGFQEALEDAGFWEQFEESIETLESLEPIPKGMLGEMLQFLESIHKVLVTYLWLSYRHPIAFIEQEEAFKLRDRTEKAMESCLHRLSAVRGKNKMSRRAGEAAADAREPKIEYISSRDLMHRRTTKAHAHSLRTSANAEEESGEATSQSELDARSAT
ncbi:P-loop containing nucleoside triphosphate hydrolase protein [Laetiporus sulphureus 93-53]|uniref:RNA helicase n=1 Tax=Laetiporus sulphureus 93-53 TaxID=1314785 RepID=A0A165H2J0_9APHY|nr:P-loop containing nucleoside triphosphate hydrolase protein [Laetiporus sulphureus 93-53]KZT11157.1 P-loop containing nucleoside triphosphate hydrolase protein [Laetiporus sulphureus 93-53]